MNWQSPASNKPHKRRAACAFGPVWFWNEDLAPSEATGFVWTLFLLPVASGGGLLFNGDHGPIFNICHFNPLHGLLDAGFPTSPLVITFGFHFSLVSLSFLFSDPGGIEVQLIKIIALQALFPFFITDTPKEQCLMIQNHTCLNASSWSELYSPRGTLSPHPFSFSSFLRL